MRTHAYIHSLLLLLLVCSMKASHPATDALSPFEVRKRRKLDNEVSLRQFIRTSYKLKPDAKQFWLPHRFWAGIRESLVRSALRLSTDAPKMSDSQPAFKQIRIPENLCNISFWRFPVNISQICASHLPIALRKSEKIVAFCLSNFASAE